MLFVYCTSPNCQYGQIHDYDDKNLYEKCPKYIVGELADEACEDILVDCLECQFDSSKMSILKHAGSMSFCDGYYLYENVYVVEQISRFSYDNLIELHQKIDELTRYVSTTNRLLKASYEIKEDQCCTLM